MSLQSHHLDVDIRAISKSFDYDDMTDGGSTSGYIDFTAADGLIPADAIVLGWKAVTTTAFTGNSSAQVQVGISGGTGNFSTTTTGSCYAAGTVSSFTVVATCHTTSTTTPRVTITSGTDFSSVSAGTMTVTIYYIAMAA